MAAPKLPITGDPDADHLLESDPLALLIGMLLDQQVPMEWAFRGPATLRERLGHLDSARIAAMDPEELVALCAQTPAIHRYPASMGRRIHALCTMVEQDYDGDAAAIWARAEDGKALVSRLRALPGYGAEKSKIFTAILAKRFGVTPPGWEAAAAPFSDGEPRSVADVDSADSLERVREWKKAMKAARRSKSDPVA
jgi:uncharacterized HhH-GPD family protein